MSYKHIDKSLNWLLDSSIILTNLYISYLEEKLYLYYIKDGIKTSYEINIGNEFKPFIYYSTNNTNYNIIRHCTSFKKILELKELFKENILILPESQFLIQYKKKLFENIGLEDLKIIVIDIETTGLDPSKNEVIFIGAKTNQLFKNNDVYFYIKNEGNEKQLLIDFFNFIHEEDPDIIVGHNIFEFDLNFLEERFIRNSLEFNLGREKTRAYKNNYQTKVHRLISGALFYQYKIPGRDVVDTMHLAMIEDTRKNEFESYNLKYLSKYLGFASEDRVYLEGIEIKNYFKDDFDTFLKYLKNDLDETYALMQTFLPLHFYISKIIPIPLQQQIYSGSTKKLTTLFLIDYYHSGRALPFPQQKKKYQGAIASAVKTGIFFNIAKWDVSSLYPSLMRYKKITPKSDTLGVFLKYLTQFMDERLYYKYKADEVFGKDKKLYNQYFFYQLGLKILINTFYGVLGTSTFIFNDLDAAEKITEYGRNILIKMKNFLENKNCIPIEMDTDGIYFQYPKEINLDDLLNELNNEMEEGIKIDFESTYKSILSYKDKNYVLLPNDFPNQDLIVKGSAFKKRGMPLYLKKWLKVSFEALLTLNIEKYEDNYFLLKKAIGQKELDIEEIIESKRISYDYQHYKNRTSGGKISYFEAMRKEGKEKNYMAGDRVFFYYKGEYSDIKTDMVKLYDPDEKIEHDDYNTEYYINKLDEWKNVLDPFYKQIKEMS